MKPSQVMPVHKKRPEIVLEEECYVPIGGLREWLQKQRGRWEWCEKCLVARSLFAHLAHRQIHAKDRLVY